MTLAEARIARFTGSDNSTAPSVIGSTGVSAFVLFHLHHDGAGLRILRREALQVTFQMRLDLAFGLGQKTQVPAGAESPAV